MRRPSFCLDVRFGLSKLTSQLGIDQIEGVFLLACIFTDALPLSHNSLRLAGKGLTEIGFFLNVPTVKRPCDGTSGLVRGNRRKAVFAFKRLFSQRNLSRFPLQGARRCCVFRKCGEKSEITEHNPIFGIKTAGRGSAKSGSGRLFLIFPRTSGAARRKYAANSGTHEHAALFAQRNRRYRRCGIPVCSVSFEFAAYFRFLPPRQAVSAYILG